MGSIPQERRFLIIAGAITALFLPFALAFPPTLIGKLAALIVLMLVAAGVAALVIKLRRKDPEEPGPGGGRP